MVNAGRKVWHRHTQLHLFAANVQQKWMTPPAGEAKTAAVCFEKDFAAAEVS